MNLIFFLAFLLGSNESYPFNRVEVSYTSSSIVKNRDIDNSGHILIIEEAKTIFVLYDSKNHIQIEYKQKNESKYFIDSDSWIKINSGSIVYKCNDFFLTYYLTFQ